MLAWLWACSVACAHDKFFSVHLETARLSTLQDLAQRLHPQPTAFTIKSIEDVYCGEELERAHEDLGHMRLGYDDPSATEDFCVDASEGPSTSNNIASFL